MTARGAALLLILLGAVVGSGAVAAERSWRLALPGERLGAPVVSPDGRWVATPVLGEQGAVTAVATVDLAAGEPGPRVAPPGGGWAVPFWLPPARLGVAGPDGVALWTAAGDAIPERWSHALVPGPVAVSADGLRLALPTEAGVLVLDTRSGQAVSRLVMRPPNAMALDAAGARLATLGPDPVGAGRLAVWGLAAGARLSEAVAPLSTALAAGPDGWLTAGPGGVTRWRADPLAVLQHTPVAWSRVAVDAARAVGLGDDGRLWLRERSGAVRPVAELTGEAPAALALAGDWALASVDAELAAHKLPRALAD